MYLFINSCLFLIIFIVARQRNLEGDFIVVSFFKKNYFYQWFHRREVSLLVKSRSMDKLRSIFFFRCENRRNSDHSVGEWASNWAVNLWIL
jgi:hypothetical protein